MMTARLENLRTLAQALGQSESEADRLLDREVVLTCSPAGERLAGYIEALLRRTLSAVTRTPLDGRSPAVEVVVGSASPRTDAPLVAVGVDGFRLGVGDGSAGRLGDCSRPIFELIAACYAAAAAVHRAVGGGLPMPLSLPIAIDFEDLYGPALSLLDRRLDLGTAFIAGAGAIGNAVVLGLSLLDVQGELHVCDPDSVSAGNLNRCWWFSDEDLDKPKAERLALRAQPGLPNVRMVTHVMTLHDALKATGDPAPSTLIVGVDSRRARRSLQNEMPRRLFDASTTGITEFVLHFNELPADNACMSCIYYESPDEAAHEAHVADALGVDLAEVQTNFVSARAARAIATKYPALVPSELEGLAFDSLFKTLCGKGELRTSEEERVLAPFAFVSVLAGVLLAFEIAMRGGPRGSAPPYNYWRLSPWGPPLKRMREQRPRRAGCEFCGDEVLQGVVRKQWG
jgi:molybdopterin/thiamine biosynthesis adenylyltransferase